MPGSAKRAVFVRALTPILPGCRDRIKSFMDTSENQISSDKIVSCSNLAKPARCLSCGTDRIKPRRRYCSKECRQQINWVLSLSKGLLRAFSARYAAFSFTHDKVILDVLPAWSKGVSRFVCNRNPRKKPAEDLKNLILQSGKEWHHMVQNNNSKSYASLFLIEKTLNEDIDPHSVKPGRKTRPRLSKYENGYLKILCLDRDDLSPDGHVVKINSAYRKMAKLYHPDVGGDEEQFKQLNKAHKQMLLWAENPLYTSRKALQDCWSYDGATNRWSPPL
ncbi:MAG: J domain-containing protein [Thermodesulfobacteriota bacterium]|nr:J domain-containing protein [Thermodesulfobacteriota bacterium]